MTKIRAFTMMLLLTAPLVPTASARSIGKIPLDTSYDIVLSGQTTGGAFKVAGIMMVVPCANPNATYVGGEAHPLDIAIKTNASAITSGVRGTIYFFTNSRLTEIVGGAEHVKRAAVNVCTVAADGRSGRVRIEMDPEYALGNALNLMTLSSGMLAIGKQIVSGSIELQFNDDGTVHGVVRLSTGQYASAGNVEYEAELIGRRTE
jgi:hypothetical protein